MMLGHHQEVHRGGWIDIVKNHAILILMDDLGWDLALDDFAENTVFTHGVCC